MNQDILKLTFDMSRLVEHLTCWKGRNLYQPQFVFLQYLRKCLDYCSWKSLPVVVEPAV